MCHDVSRKAFRGPRHRGYHVRPLDLLEPLTGSLFELLVVLGYALGAGALTGLGALAEGAGLRSLGAGDVVVGLWFAYMGAVALFVGLYLLGYRELLPRLRRAVGGASPAD